jgi:hypothetical protein
MIAIPSLLVPVTNYGDKHITQGDLLTAFQHQLTTAISEMTELQCQPKGIK